MNHNERCKNETKDDVDRQDKLEHQRRDDSENESETDEPPSLLRGRVGLRDHFVSGLEGVDECRAPVKEAFATRPPGTSPRLRVSTQGYP